MTLSHLDVRLFGVTAALHCRVPAVKFRLTLDVPAWVKFIVPGAALNVGGPVAGVLKVTGNVAVIREPFSATPLNVYVRVTGAEMSAAL